MKFVLIVKISRDCRGGLRKKKKKLKKMRTYVSTGVLEA